MEVAAADRKGGHQGHPREENIEIETTTSAVKLRPSLLCLTLKACLVLNKNVTFEIYNSTRKIMIK